MRNIAIGAHRADCSARGPTRDGCAKAVCRLRSEVGRVVALRIPYRVRCNQARFGVVTSHNNTHPVLVLGCELLRGMKCSAGSDSSCIVPTQSAPAAT
jgi:hypothetical protein